VTSVSAAADAGLYMNTAMPMVIITTNTYLTQRYRFLAQTTPRIIIGIGFADFPSTYQHNRDKEFIKTSPLDQTDRLSTGSKDARPINRLQQKPLNAFIFLLLLCKNHAKLYETIICNV